MRGAVAVAADLKANGKNSGFYRSTRELTKVADAVYMHSEHLEVAYHIFPLGPWCLIEVETGRVYYEEG